MKRYEVHIGGIAITLAQMSEGTFSVRYGIQFESGLNYSEAASKFGQCVMHALACEGVIDADV
jgi:hypothetical protein